MLTHDELEDMFAWLVGGAMGTLFSQVQDRFFGGCCPVCCGPCSALKTMLDSGDLDRLFAHYLMLAQSRSVMWDAENGRVDREFLADAWSVDLGCGPHE